MTRHICIVDKCESFVVSKGFCDKHRQRIRKHGNLEISRNENGTGSIRADGYVRVGINNRSKLMHVLIAEKALGKQLTLKAIVHHVDGNPTNNENKNLVICPNAAYHFLLHRRQEAMKACGDPNMLKCSFCHAWDSPEKITTCRRHYFHKKCRNKSMLEWRKRKTQCLS